jgi:hypothetical protein
LHYFRQQAAGSRQQQRQWGVGNGQLKVHVSRVSR